jgi:hypothetical protein
MRSWIHFTRGRFVRQARVGLGDLREEYLSRHGFVVLSFLPRSCRCRFECGGAAILFPLRAEFQARRTPGMRRTRTGIGIDTYRSLDVSPEFARMTG